MKKSGHKLKAPLALLGLVLSIVVIPMNAAHADWTTPPATGTDPRMMVFDQAGNLYIANYGSNNVTKITPTGVSAILGPTGANPRGIAIDAEGNIYTANFGSNNVSRITPTGSSAIYATTGTQPAALVFDQSGNLYTANYGSNDVSKITPDRGSTIFASTGSKPLGITIDSGGNLYTSNNLSNDVSIINTDGNSEIYARVGTSPNGITIDSDGNVYTANSNSNNVSKINTDRMSRILAATGTYPFAIAVDSLGNIYTSNQASNNVSQISQYGYTGDKFGVSRIVGTTPSAPMGIAIDSSGNVYTANKDSRNVSKITPLSSTDTYSCATGLKSTVAPTYSITDGVVLGGYDCSGQVTISSQATAIGNMAFGSDDANRHSSLTSIIIPNTVTAIGDFSFTGVPLASITIPNSVTFIGIRAFSDTNLQSIIIPSSITLMAQRVFVGARSLTSVVIQNGITELRDYLFDGCNLLTSFDIPNTVTSLGDNTFSNSGITSLTVPNSVITIGQSFRDSSITSITIGSGVSFIHPNAFYDMPRLASITVDAGNPNFSSVSGVLLNKDGTELIQYPAGKVGTSYVIPNGVTTIDKEYTFDRSTLTAITIPNSVTQLRDNVFGPLQSTLQSYEYCEITLTSSNFSSAGLSGKTKTCPNTSPRISAGTEPNSKVATIPLGVTTALIAATDALPGTKLNFGGTVPTAVTVAPVANNAPASATPFVILGSTKIVDIKISGTFNGSATICLDGTPTDHLYHFKDGAWIELASRSYVNGQVCGVTTSFSPFAAAGPLLPPAFTLSKISESVISGTPVSGYSINSTGGDIASYSISPAISNGLSFDSNTGLISGNPVAGATVKTYTITATNATGFATAIYSLTVVAPYVPPVPDPVQQSKITALSVATAIAGTPTPVEITGSFVEKIRAIQINGVALPAGSWTQTASSVAFTLPGKSAGTYQIQLFNGSAPVLKVQNFTFTAPIVVVAPTPVPTAKPKVTYIRCAKPGHGTRVAYGVNPTCPAGYVKK